jgi:hypothetical protein
MTDITTSQNTDPSSWDILYNVHHRAIHAFEAVGEMRIVRGN